MAPDALPIDRQAISVVVEMGQEESEENWHQPATRLGPHH
jgi:hypothetical protein